MVINMPEDFMTLFDEAPLNRRYWLIFALMAAVFVFDFFDFVIVGYLLAAVAPEWHLTYGQSAVILYSGGIGAIVGAVLFGAFADAWGRKKQVVIGTLMCAISSGLIAFIPNGSWFLFAIFRFFVGAGLSAAVTPSITIVVELTPHPTPHYGDKLLPRIFFSGWFDRSYSLGNGNGLIRLARSCFAWFCCADHRYTGLDIHS